MYILTFLFREAHGTFCTELYSCDQTCYEQSKYYTSCGWLFGWGSCSRYSTNAYTCKRTCDRQVCCAGYTGSNCDIPICSPVCQNGGTCISPDCCGCTSGFEPPNCNDINECVGAHGCQHTCVNTRGSFYCSCRSGYTLSSDLKTCIGVSECNTNNGGCQHTCINTVGSFYCQCIDGYKLNGDAKTCSDIDECAAGTSGCAQTCSNTVGSFTCSCRNGYSLAVNGKSCEVLQGNVSHLCDNQPVGGACKEGCPCVVRENSSTSSLAQGDAGNHMVYIVIGMAMLLVIVLTIVATYCVMKRKKRQNNTPNTGGLIQSRPSIPSIQVNIRSERITICKPKLEIEGYM